jgi:hypothetical protein
MYLVAAYDPSNGGWIVDDTIRLLRKESLVLKHLRYIAKNQWPDCPMDFKKLLDNGWYKVYNLETNAVKKSPRPVSKSKILKWVEDEKFAKVVVIDVKRKQQQ